MLDRAKDFFIISPKVREYAWVEPIVFSTIFSYKAEPHTCCSYNKSIPFYGMLLQVRSAQRRVGVLSPSPNVRPPIKAQ